MEKLLFAGDFFFDYPALPDDFRAICNWVRENGYRVVLNLEMPLDHSGIPAQKRGPNLYGSSEAVQALKELNVVGVCLANNHMMDYGTVSLERTLALLDENGIAHTGAGRSLTEALQPMVVGSGEQQAVIINFGWDVEEALYAQKGSAGCAPRDETVILHSLSEAKRLYPALPVVPCFHWGFEHNRYPMPFDIDLAHKCLDVGAELIIGHHPHVIQPYEVYRGKYCFYSLGNFYFGSRRDRYNRRFPGGRIQNLNDFGALTSYDFSRHTAESFLVEYRNGQSVIMENHDNILFRLSDIDFLSNEYALLARKWALNENPILGIDREKNRKAVRRLYQKYAIAKRLRFLKKSKIGSGIYSILKKISRFDK